MCSCVMSSADHVAYVIYPTSHTHPKWRKITTRTIHFLSGSSISFTQSSRSMIPEICPALMPHARVTPSSTGRRGMLYLCINIGNIEKESRRKAVSCNGELYSREALNPCIIVPLTYIHLYVQAPCKHVHISEIVIN